MLNDHRTRRSALLWKLLGINVPILALVLVVVWISIDTLAAGYFSTLMERYHISPEETNRMFLDAVHRYLIWTVAAALSLAILFSYLLTRRVLRPLAEMAQMTGQVAAGNFAARIRVQGHDELAELGRAFNRMADGLQRVEQLRKNLVADVAHELRTPLTNVRGYLEALRDGVLPPETSTFAMLQAEVQRLTKLANDLLELAQADAARAHLQAETVDLAQLIDSVLGLNERHFAAKGIAVHTQFGQALPAAHADPEKVLLALGNLVENAWQYAPSGSTLRVETARLDGEIRATFSNESSVVTDDDLSLIFERFYRTEQSRSRNHGGAGIGLSVVKEIIEAHGGRVGADHADGRLRIWFSLPAVS